MFKDDSFFPYEIKYDFKKKSPHKPGKVFDFLSDDFLYDLDSLLHCKNEDNKKKSPYHKDDREFLGYA